MVNIAFLHDIKNIFIPVSFEIDKKNVHKFIKTSLDLNKINYQPSDKIYCTYLGESKQYQIIIHTNLFSNTIFELFQLYVSNIQNEYLFDLYVCPDFFVVYKNNSFYCYQELTQQFSDDEIAMYISNTFKIKIKNTYQISSEKLLYLTSESKKNHLKPMLINMNKTTKTAFLLYVFYIVVLLLSVQGYIQYKNYQLKQEDSYTVNKNKQEYKKALTLLQYKPFYKDYESIVSNIKKHKIKLISMSYESKQLKLSISSLKKDKLFDFLNIYQKQISSTSISFDKTKKLYKCITDVKIFR